MKKNMLRKDFYMEIAKSLNRFVSIFLIVAMGVAFFSGIRASEPDIRYTADDYFDERGLMDVRVLGTMGLTEDDVAAINAMEGVEYAVGSYALDVLVSDEESQKVFKIMADMGDKNRIDVIEGRMPEQAGECLIDAGTLGNHSFNIGDTITFESGDDSDILDMLKMSDFKVVGIGSSPEFITYTRGSTTIGNGELDAFAVVAEDSFVSDVYTKIDVWVEGAKDAVAYTDAYEDRVAQVQKQIEDTLADSRCQLRYASVTEEAKEKIDDAQRELSDAKAEAEAELSDARETLESSEAELLDGRAVIEEKKAELASGKAEIAANEKKLADGWAELRANEAVLKNGWNQYYSGLADYEAGVVQLEANRQTLADGRAAYEAGVAALESQKAEAYAKFEEEFEVNFDQQFEASFTGTVKEQFEAAFEAEFEAGVAGERQQLEDLKNKTIPEYTAQLEQARAGLPKAQAGLEQAVGALGQAQTSLGQTQTALAEVNAQIEALTAAGQEIPKELSAKQAELSAAVGKIQGTVDELKRTVGELTATVDQLSTAITQLSAAIPAMQTQYENGIAAIEEAKVSAREQALLAAKEAAKGPAKEEARKLMEAQLSEALAPYEQELAAAKSELEAGEQAFAAGEAKLLEAKALLDSSYASLSTGQAQLDGGKQELSQGQTQLNTVKAQLVDGEAQLAEAEQTLLDGEQELADGWKEYEEGKAEAEAELSEAQAEIDDARAELEALAYPKWYVNDRSFLSGNSEMGDNADRIRAIGQIFPVLFFLVAALISLTTMTRMVEEQRIQIGTLKALGYSKVSIAKKYLFYALLATLGGSIVGILLGEKVLPYIIISAYKIVYPYIPNVTIPYNLEYALMAAGAAIVCITFAAFMACYKELAATPAALMRPVPPKQGKRILLERITPLWRRISFTQKSTLRNLFRYKKRFCMTVFGIGGCMALMVVGFGLKDSIFDIVQLQYNKIQPYSGMVILDEDASQQDKAMLYETLEGEAAISGYKTAYMMNMDISSKTKDWEAYIVVPENMENLEDFIYFNDRTSGEEYTLGDDGVIISEKTASMLGVSVGDSFSIKEDDFVADDVKISAVCENYVGHYIYMTPTYYEELFGKNAEYNSVLVVVDGGEDQKGAEDHVGQILLKQDAVVNVSYMDSIRGTLEDMLSTLDMIIVVLIVSAGMLAFIVLYNLNNININERRRELASIKVLGFYDLELAAYVYRENIYLTLIGMLFGVILGKILHQFIIVTVEIDSCMFGRNINWPSYVYSMLLTLAFSIFVNLVMFFKLRKIDMVESLKSVE